MKFGILCIIFVYSCSYTYASNVKFNNRCGYSVNVIRTVNGQSPVSECNIGPGQTCSRGYGSNGMNFKNGWGGKTLAEFSFNSWNGLDFYDLSLIVGYDTPMQITTSTGGPTVTCTYGGCPDAYQYRSDDKKTHDTTYWWHFQCQFLPIMINYEK